VDPRHVNEVVSTKTRQLLKTNTTLIVYFIMIIDRVSQRHIALGFAYLYRPTVILLTFLHITQYTPWLLIMSRPIVISHSSHSAQFDYLSEQTECCPQCSGQEQCDVETLLFQQCCILAHPMTMSWTLECTAVSWQPQTILAQLARSLATSAAN